MYTNQIRQVFVNRLYSVSHYVFPLYEKACLTPILEQQRIQDKAVVENLNGMISNVRRRLRQREKKMKELEEEIERIEAAAE